MILTSEQRSKEYVEAGLWGSRTLDRVLADIAAEHPDRAAFLDVIEGEPGSKLSYAEAHLRIEALAAFFAILGLKADTVVGLHLPNAAEASIVQFAAWRAGLVVAPLPLHWSDAEITRAIELTGMKAIVTSAFVGGLATGERMRDIAADNFAIRFVLGIGEDLPDGLIDLGEVLRDAEALGEAPAVPRHGNAADHVAALAFSRRDGSLVVAPYTHNQLIACGIAHADAAGLADGAVLCSSMLPGGLAAIGAGLAGMLATKGTFVCAQATSLGNLAATILVEPAEQAILPAGIADGVAEFLAAGSEERPGLSLVSASTDAQETVVPAGFAVTDVSTLGGLVLVSSPRLEGVKTPLWPNGAWRLSDGRQIGTVGLKPRMRAGDRRPMPNSGEIVIKGAAVPDTPWPEPASGGGRVLAVNGEGLLRTGLFGEATEEGRLVRPTGTIAETLAVGSETFDLAALDTQFAKFPGLLDAATFRVADPLFGSRIGLAYVTSDGRSISREDLEAFLSNQGLGEMMWPTLMVRIDAVPRSKDGRIQRSHLFKTAVAA
ncbi:Short-chain-fatty-acid-CoA ligase [Hartmannibacter diazotrophicus]|uniref:Short-chain-fatty-acid-CoA ligase n=1 Tax=Hartmannibacter diazotrophicus TaxID=1482074 RepID=A0A2C9D6E9_9HYPH|nr:class I adenylate-forming enzyme family protein [Hartmannibacter diazotrophicus]SON55902.1 Short-chain-fatty-acid-CoA ligase [Hartmannibacter diazotrophicus]